MSPSAANSTPQSVGGREELQTDLRRPVGGVVAPAEAALVYLVGSVVILALGMGLNHALTDGTYRSAAEAPSSRLGTGAAYITDAPYDVVSLGILLAALLALGVGFLAPRRPALNSPWFMATASLSLVFLILWSLHRSGAVLSGQPTLLVTVGLILAFVSAAWLLARQLGPGRRMHYVRAAGFVLFGLYWATNVMRLYVVEQGDFVNAAFAAGAVFFFNYFAYHEFLSVQRGEDPRALQWLAGASFLTTGVYVATHKIKVIAEWLIVNVAEQTTWLLQFFGQDVYRDPDGGKVPGALIYYPTNPADPAGSGGFFPIEIILACTAVQSIMIFVGGIAALRPPMRGDGVSGRPSIFERLRPTYGTRRLFALLLTVPLIYSLNLFRNFLIISLSATGHPAYFADHPGATDFFCQFSTDSSCRPDTMPTSHALYMERAASASFWFTHNIIGKGGSLVALIIIAFMVFQILPELYDSLVGLLDLKRRRGPLERFFARAPARARGVPRAPAASTAEGTDRPPPTPAEGAESR